jgi:hypothetical protein
MVTEYKPGYIISSMPVDVDDRVLAASAPPETVLVDSDESPDTTPSARGSQLDGIAELGLGVT